VAGRSAGVASRSIDGVLVLEAFCELRAYAQRVDGLRRLIVADDPVGVVIDGGGLSDASF